MQLSAKTIGGGESLSDSNRMAWKKFGRVASFNYCSRHSTRSARVRSSVFAVDLSTDEMENTTAERLDG